MYATHAPVHRACSNADTAICIGLQNTINVRVLSGLLCLYSIDIFVETIPAHLPITTIITTCTRTLRTPAKSTHQPNPNPNNHKPPFPQPTPAQLEAVVEAAMTSPSRCPFGALVHRLVEASSFGTVKRF